MVTSLRLRKSKYIILPENRNHPDLLVAKSRLSYTLGIGKRAQKLGFNVENTAQEQKGSQYIGNITQGQAIRLNLELGGKTLSIKEFTEFLKLLNLGVGDRKRVFNERGNLISSRELTDILTEITEQRKPVRGEFLGDRFQLIDGLLYIKSDYQLINGKLLPQKIEPIDFDTLIEDKLPRISLDDWVNKPTAQGLPRNSIKKGSLYYWSPREGRFVGFDAGAGGILLYCVGDPASLYPALGVRHIREK